MGEVRPTLLMVQVNRQILASSILCVVLIVADQYFKWLAVTQQIPVILNQGVSFGWVLVPAVWQTVLIGLLLVTLTMLWWWLPRWQLTAILAGGWSNWIDRVTIGAVIDWLPIPGTSVANNLADYWIMIGVLGLLFSSLWPSRKKNRTTV